MNILVVDDEKTFADVLCENFLRSGENASTMNNAVDAIHYLKDNDVDVVILDINMPDMNGIEVLRQMKEINPTLPVILSTAYHEYKQDLGAWASDEYVVKSSDLGELKEAVRRYLS